MMSIRTTIATLFTALALALPWAASAAVDVNKASQAELESVKGIGPGLSGKILAARQQGAFKDWADMVERVSGVGPGNAARFSQAGLTVAGSAYTANDAAKAEAPKTEGGSRRKAAAEAGTKAEAVTKSEAGSKKQAMQ